MTDRCNDCGVYEVDETLTLPRDRAGWRGLPTAEIELRRLGDRWIWSASYMLMDGATCGHGQPLCDRPRYRAADRRAALDAAKARLIADVGAKDARDARRIVAWVGCMEPAQGSLF